MVACCWGCKGRGLGLCRKGSRDSGNSHARWLGAGDAGAGSRDGEDFEARWFGVGELRTRGCETSSQCALDPRRCDSTLNPRGLGTHHGDYEA